VSEILSRIGNHECEEENRDTECRNEGSPGSFERAEERTLKLFGNSWKFVLPIGMRCGRSIQSLGGFVCV